MTKDEFSRKIDYLTDEDFVKDLRHECMRLFLSGAVNIEEYEDNYRLPKNILMIALENFATQHDSPNTVDKKEIRNLRKF